MFYFRLLPNNLHCTGHKQKNKKRGQLSKLTKNKCFHNYNYLKVIDTIDPETPRNVKHVKNVNSDEYPH